uniref:Genome polyprotein n=1 Tax=rhinovirus C11 TaxID=1240004 RepID=A0A8F5I903_9ENTO|nr:polyprotein [rhinovirus C11]
MGAQVSKQNVGSHESGISASSGSVIKYFNINYYKDSASSGLSKQDFSMDPEKFTKPLADVMTNPALMSPSIEACGFSDRLKQITIGSSTITTQDTLNTVVAYGEWPEYLRDTDASAVDKPTHPETSTDRFYTLTSVIWNGSSKGWWWKIPDCLKDMGMFGQNMYHHALGRSGYIFHIQCNATKFHSGLLLVAIVPEHQLAYVGGTYANVGYNHTHPGEGGHEIREPTGRDDKKPDEDPLFNCNGTLLGNLTIFPHQLINLRTNNSVTIVVPYINCVPMDSMLKHNNISLVIIPLVPLRSGSTQAPQTLPITISIAPDKSEFSGARQSNKTQGIPIRMPSGAQQFMTTEDEQSANLLPSFHPTSVMHIPGEITNVMHMARVDSFMPINNIKQKLDVPIYSLTVTARSAGVNGELILTIPLNMSNTLFSTTLLGEVLNYFSTWAGSITLNFLCVCDSFSTGKFLIAYTPPGGGIPASRKDAMLGVHVIWDLGLQSTCSIVVPWISQGYYRHTKADNYTESGYVTLWYQTDFVPGSTIAQGSILVTCSACSDMAVRMLRDTPMIKQVADLLQNPVEQFVDNVLEEVLVVPNTQPSGPIHTTRPTALSAMEIGASSDVKPEDMIETRYVVNSRTNDEATIENFLGRSALWANVSMTGGYATWSITYQGNAQIRKKLELFTYVRFDLEITIITSSSDLIQIMYVPPGANTPKSNNATEWNTASNPSIFFQPGNGFPRFTIPFTGLGSAYYMFYDGYDIVSHENGIYGISTTNDMGSLCFRTPNNNSGTETIRVFGKPKHTRAWIPRPPRATGYTHRYSTNYNRKVSDDDSTLTRDHYIETRASVKTAGPSDMYVHTKEAIYKNAHLTSANEQTILIALTADLQVDAADHPGDDVIPDCDCTTGTYYCKSKDRYYPIEVVSHAWYPIEETCYYPKHIQYNILLGEGPCVPGDCGGKLLCKHGVIGIVTAGGENHVAFTDLRPYSNLAHTQGPISDYVTQLGNAFGTGFTQTLETNLRETCSGMFDAITSKTVKWVVRIISALTIVIRNSSDMPTILATMALLGCTGSPWQYLKRKLCNWLGVQKPPSKQSDSWLKKFTEWCNAAKGLEWIGYKISKFIDWLKEKLIPTVQRKKDTLLECKKLTLYEDQVRAFPQSPEAFQNELTTKLQILKKNLDDMCPLYAAENKRVTNMLRDIKTMTAYKKTHRTEPVCVLIHGGPGCGKSLATTVIARGLTDSGNVYSLPPSPKHFDGYCQQQVVMMDDLGQNPDGQDLAMFCQMVSTTDFIVPMAALEDKGKSFTSDFVLASTNLNQLSPPTVTIPEAITRRFFLDVDLKIMSGYRTHAGLLDTAKALQACPDCAKPPHYKQCCPLLCGKAVVLQNRRTSASLSLNMVVSQLREESNTRKRIHTNLNAIFQGLGSDETPGFIVDLLSSSKDPRVIEYCEREGLIVKATHSLEKSLEYTQYCLNCLGSLILILGTIYAIYKLLCISQGAYTGNANPVPRKPELRKAVKQGPEHEFVHSLIRRNCHVATTSRGDFNLLGIHDNCAVLPTHAECGDTILIDNIQTRVIKQQIITDCNDVDTEITIVWLDRNEKFRDIRRFIPEHIEEWRNMRLATNVPKFPMMDVEVGDVCPYGEINLSGNLTCRLLKYNYPTQPGQCGAVVANVGNIVAIHVGGNGRVGYGAALLRKYFTAVQGEITTRKTVKDVGIAPINTPSKTKLYPSVFYDIFPGEKEPAALHDKDPRLDVGLKEAVMSKYKGNKNCQMNEYVLTAAKHYAAQLFPLDINPEPITMEQAVYGTDYLEPLDLNTSAGYPYVTLGIKKKDILNRSTKDLSKLQHMMDLYGIDLPYITYLKDELRTPEKIRCGKTRCIEAASMNDTVYFRMVFGNLYSTFHKNPGVLTGSAVGCDPDVFWSQMRATMGENILAFDYTNYDGSLDPIWFDALKIVLNELGFDGELTEKLKKTVHVYKDEVYTVLGGMPSGTSGTSIFNTMINNIIIRTITIETYRNIDLDKLKIIAYGDDVVVSYPDPLDASHLAETGSKYGLTITPADKSTEFKQITWDTVTFLKRGFKSDPKYPFLIHPVYPMKDVFESIRWTKDPRNTQDHVNSLCLLAWHNGKQQYEDFVQKVRSVPVGRTLYLPPYEYLERRWIDKFI